MTPFSTKPKILKLLRCLEEYQEPHQGVIIQDQEDLEEVETGKNLRLQLTNPNLMDTVDLQTTQSKNLKVITLIVTASMKQIDTSLL